MMSPDEHNRLEEWAKTYAVLGLLGFLSTLLIGGKLVHHLLLYRGFVCRVAVVPPSVISGIIGLIWIFILDICDELITADLTSGLSSLKITLVNFVFAALTLGLFCSRSYSQHSNLRAIFLSILHEGMPMVIYSQILIWGQSCVCLMISCAMSYFRIKTPHLAAAMVPLGIEAGSDVIPTAVYQNDWSRTVVQEAESLGLFASIILGVIAVSVKRLYRGAWTGSTRSELHTRIHSFNGEFEAFGKGSGARQGRAKVPDSPAAKSKKSLAHHGGLISRVLSSAGSSSPRVVMESTHSSSDVIGVPTQSGPPPLSPPKYSTRAVFDAPSSSLGTHVSLIFLAVFLSFNFGLFARIFESNLEWFRDHRILSGVRMFEMSIACSVLIIHSIQKNTTFTFRPEWFMRLSGLMLDMLVIAALSSAIPRPERVEQVDYTLVSVYVIACAVWNVFAFIFLAKSMFPNFWFERGVTLTGEAMGHSFMGLLLVRALDPAMATPVPAAYLCKLMLFIFPSSGGKNTIVVSLVAAHGLYIALAVCLCVVVAWAVIFSKFFKMRFVKGDDSDSESGRALASPRPPSRSRSGSRSGDAGMGVIVKSGSSGMENLRDVLEFDSFDAEEQEIDNDGEPLIPADGEGNDGDLMLPHVKILTSEVSAIVSTSHLQKIANWVPPHEDMRHISLRYSLQRDGASMESLLSLCKSNSSRRHGQNSCIVFIEDSWGYIFGAYLAHGLEDSHSYYGNGESFVFSLVPTPAAYKWTGMNEFFVLSNCRNIAIGGGGGGFSIHLDDELNTGVSNSSDTYKNPILSSNEFFKCLNVEVWVIDSNEAEFAL